MTLMNTAHDLAEDRYWRHRLAVRSLWRFRHQVLETSVEPIRQRIRYHLVEARSAKAAARKALGY